MELNNFHHDASGYNLMKVEPSVLCRELKPGEEVTWK